MLMSILQPVMHNLAGLVRLPEREKAQMNAVVQGTTQTALPVTGSYYRSQREVTNQGNQPDAFAIVGDTGRDVAHRVLDPSSLPTTVDAQKSINLFVRFRRDYYFQILILNYRITIHAGRSYFASSEPNTF
ncbi:MAG: hypothetical protein U5L72_01360 [Bacteroidales bacterium]|nr:hypothetical protein [Bacteroidales bacterium]